MSIHEAVLQPIAAFVYCNRQAAAGRRQQAKDGNFHVPAPAQLNALRLRPWAELAKIILFHFMMEPRVK